MLVLVKKSRRDKDAAEESKRWKPINREGSRRTATLELERQIKLAEEDAKQSS